jgi:hypothetical protein
MNECSQKNLTDLAQEKSPTDPGTTGLPSTLHDLWSPLTHQRTEKPISAPFRCHAFKYRIIVERPWRPGLIYGRVE